tara:strand:- start:1088 stop:2221 length:1134 start_codon:yes stop_codon:yes gene_type:complete
MEFILKLSNRNRIIFIFLSIVVVGFFIQTISKGLSNSCDLMWQPSKLFWDGINHYEYQMRTRDVFLGCQHGRYGHFLFIFLYPITLVEWEQAKIMWITLNVFFALSIPILLCRFNKISTLSTYLIIGIFLTCHPTRMTLNLGQNSLMMLFFLMLPFLKVSSGYKNFNLIFSGISYVKYSTGYILFLNLLVEKKLKKLLLTSFLTIFGWLFYSYYTNSPLIANFFEPLKMNFQDNYSRTGDLYSIMNIYFLKENNFTNKILQLGIVLFGNLYFLYQIKNIKNKLAKLSVICFLPLIFMPHSNYDYVLMLPLLIYVIKNYKFAVCKYGLYLTIYYFYFHRIIRHLIDNDMFYQSGMFLFFTIFIIFFINHIKKNNLLSA